MIVITLNWVNLIKKSSENPRPAIIFLTLWVAVFVHKFCTSLNKKGKANHSFIHSPDSRELLSFSPFPKDDGVIVIQTHRSQPLPVRCTDTQNTVLIILYISR